ncbi:predicted protein [Nematostella vectensis]|uniref:Peptidase S1 domain-containing protein n=1 Tax=Nematostella vectensis TaxID=45351 RepID=A7SZJ2_NEMVE|nr:serine protease 23 [Nematostella vectensis]EDO30879.1 predicted protein [Nematostella vectensis]|eukprot:XP_001622979.1 predicted protein [Nematostella vectensis]
MVKKSEHFALLVSYLGLTLLIVSLEGTPNISPGSHLSATEYYRYLNQQRAIHTRGLVSRSREFSVLRNIKKLDSLKRNKRRIFWRDDRKKNDYSSYTLGTFSSSFKSNTKSISLKRKRRQIFGRDDRKEIDELSSTREPFVSSVKLWSDVMQCSGTLIGPCHVITAAHCIHNGKWFVSPLTAILVGVSNTSSTDDLDYFAVEGIYLPPEWLSGKDFSHEHDYALLKLTEATNIPYMDIKPLRLQTGTQVRMASFPSDKKYGTKWFTKCKILGDLGEGMFKHYCDAVVGSSGAGMYVSGRLAHARKPVLVGILVSFWELMKGKRPVTGANTAVRITPFLQQRVNRFRDVFNKC